MRLTNRKFIHKALFLASLLLVISGVSVVSSASACLTILMGGAIQGRPLNLTTAVSTPAVTDGTGVAASFRQPRGITTDGISLYVADTMNHTVRKIVIATGVVSTLAGTVGVSGSKNSTSTDTTANFYWPKGITTDGTNLYVTDSENHTVRKIVIATGVVSTLAGRVGESGSTDDTGTVASFNGPIGITTDGTNLYVTDSGNHTVRKIVIATGVVSTLAGKVGDFGSKNGTGTTARFNYPRGITTDGTSLYVADVDNHTVRKIELATDLVLVSTLAGTPRVSGSNDGPGTTASFWWPVAITTDGTSVYVTDTGNCTVRKIVIKTRVVSTPAGTAGTCGIAVDGTGAQAVFLGSRGITSDGASLYLTDTDGSSTVRRIQ